MPLPLLVLPIVLASTAPETPMRITSARAISVTGDVAVEIDAHSTPLQRFDEVPQGAIVATGPESLVSLRLASGSMVRIGPNSRLELTQLETGQVVAQRKEHIRLLMGRVWVRVMSLLGSESKFEVETETAVAGVRGTAFWVLSDGATSRFVVDHGTIAVRRHDAEQVLSGPGASLDAGRGVPMSVPTRLSQKQMRGLSRATWGRAGALRETARQMRDTRHGTPQLQRQRNRRTLVGPDRLVDSPAPHSRGHGANRRLGTDAARIRVRLNLPKDAARDDQRPGVGAGAP